jgi:hypothetical protein
MIQKSRESHKSHKSTFRRCDWFDIQHILLTHFNPINQNITMTTDLLYPLNFVEIIIGIKKQKLNKNPHRLMTRVIMAGNHGMTQARITPR